MIATKKAPGGTGTLLRFAWQQLRGGARKRENFPALENFAAIGAALNLLPEGVKPRVVDIDLAGTDAGWRSSGSTVRVGQGFTVFADGVVWMSEALGVGVSPTTALWLRIAGRAPIKKMTAHAASFDAWGDGELEFCLKPPGEWLDESGAFDPAVPRTGAKGAVVVTLALWPGDATSGMTAFERMTGMKAVVPETVKRAPEGWSYLWRLGEGSIYSHGEDAGKNCIHVHTHGDVGILQYPIEMVLEDDTVLEWRWRVDRLPSLLPEHIQPTHDYLSIAVEYENGQDLTYFWSASLPKDTVFKCPLAWWSERETHWVVRSGKSELGTWQSERRSLKSDYANAIHGAVPARVVRVWLIANSAFQRGHGEAHFADIALVSGGVRRQIV